MTDDRRTDLCARATTVALYVVGTKLWVLAHFHRRLDGIPFAHKLFAPGPDLLIAAVLVGALSLVGRVPSRVLGVLASAFVGAVVAANVILAVVLVLTRRYFSLADPHPAFAGLLPTLVNDLGSARFVLPLAAAVVGYWAIPWALRRALRGRRFALPSGARTAVVVLVPLYWLAGSMSVERDDLRLLTLRPNPLVEYVVSWVRPAAFPGLDGGVAESPEEIARALLPVATAAGFHEEPDALAELRDERPNIVLVVMESVGASAVDLDARAPRHAEFLASLRPHAVVFRRYSSPVPFSDGALAAMFCSRFPLPHRLGGSKHRMLDGCRPLARLLEAHGVATAMFTSFPFGDWFPREFYEHFAFGTLADSNAIVAARAAAGWPVETVYGRLVEHETVSELLAWADGQCAARRPFFGVYYSELAHWPYAPAGYPGTPPVAPHTPPRELYRRLVPMLGAQIERLYDWTAAHECGRSTLLLVVGDHGEAFDEHPGDRLHGVFPYDTTLRVPLFAIHPKLAGRVSERVASHVDLAPTVLDLMLGDPAPSPSPGEPPFVYHQGRPLTRPGGPWPVFAGTVMGDGFVVERFGQFKFIQGLVSSRLFDTDRDPNETSDLRQQRPELAAALRAAMANFAAYQRELQGRVTDERVDQGKVR